jgi:tetrahydrodipicolinate N-succinyltransferase
MEPIVVHHALINAGARVDRNCIINTKALAEHDAIIEDHCHISTGAIVKWHPIFVHTA